MILTVVCSFLYERESENLHVNLDICRLASMAGTPAKRQRGQYRCKQIREMSRRHFVRLISMFLDRILQAMSF